MLCQNGKAERIYVTLESYPETDPLKAEVESTYTAEQGGNRECARPDERTLRTRGLLQVTGVVRDAFDVGSREDTPAVPIAPDIRHPTCEQPPLERDRRYSDLFRSLLDCETLFSQTSDSRERARPVSTRISAILRPLSGLSRPSLGTPAGSAHGST